MTSHPVPERPQQPGTRPPLTDDPAGVARIGDEPGLGRSPATAATVGLATAARVLGLSPATALALAEHEQFPCSVIKTTAGFRVPFGSLLRVLRSSRSQSSHDAGNGRHQPDRKG